MNGWPNPKELERQAWLANNTLALANAAGVPMVDILAEMKARTEARKTPTAEDALLQLYQEYERPAPEGEGQLHLIIKDGALVAPGEVSDE